MLEEAFQDLRERRLRGARFTRAKRQLGVVEVQPGLLQVGVRGAVEQQIERDAEPVGERGSNRRRGLAATGLQQRDITR